MNYIDEELLLLERPNIRKECNISSDEEMSNYLLLYSVYNSLLVQFFMEEYSLKDIDEQMIKYSDSFTPVNSDDMDLYQSSSLGFLKYFYIRNNIYVERLTDDDIRYLFDIAASKDFKLDDKKRNFVRRTYISTILEKPTQKNCFINYGPDNGKFMRPSNAIIIGVRYDEFANLKDEDALFDMFSSSEGKLQILIGFLEYKIKHEKDIPFSVIKYDEFSVNQKKKLTNVVKS